MAKNAPSKHSRAARRATSPGIDVDKSLKHAKPPPESANHRPSILGLHQSAGVTKKSKKRKSVLSSKARRRHEKALERGEAAADRTSTKIQKSKGQSNKIQTRNKAWDDINKAAGEVVKSEKGETAEPEQEEAEGVYATTDEEMSDAEVAGAASGMKNMISAEAAAVPLPEPMEDEDEIL